MHELVAEAVELEREFICEALQVGQGARVLANLIGREAASSRVCAGVTTSELEVLSANKNARQASRQHSQTALCWATLPTCAPRPSFHTTAAFLQPAAE